MNARAIVAVLALLGVSCASAVERGPSSPSSSAEPPSSSTERKEVPAPIDGLEVRVLESNPPQYLLSVKAGLPSGCAQRNRHETRREADAITVTVLNWMPAGSPPCTMIYGSYDVNINLGSDFRSGITYTVSVNDKKTTFVAQ
jgi:hypothetical protein